MNCQKVLELLSDYLDQQLSDDKYAFVSSHLATCAQCREIFEQMQMVQVYMLDLEKVEPPKDLKTNVMAEILAMEEKQADVIPFSELKCKKKRRWHIKRLAAAFVIFFMSVGYGLQPVYLQALDKSAPMEITELADDGMMIRSVAPLEKGPQTTGSEERDMLTPAENVENAEVPKGTDQNELNVDATFTVETSSVEMNAVEEPEKEPEKDGTEKIDPNITLTNNEMVVYTAEDKIYGTMEDDATSKNTEKRLIISSAGVLLAAYLFFMSRVKN